MTFQSQNPVAPKHFTTGLAPFLLLWTGSLFLLSSCATYAVYQHPMHNNVHAYKAMPLQADHTPAAVYASGSVIRGEQNESWNDKTWALNGSLHAAHNLRSFQFLYGVNGTVGNYNMGKYDDYASIYPNYEKINKVAGNTFIAAAGAVAAANFVIPFKQYGEWRVIGLEYNFQQELDNDYAQKRKDFLEEDVNAIDRSRNYSTLGLTSDFLGNLHAKVTYGMKLEYGLVFRKIEYTENGIDRDLISRKYFTCTVHAGDFNYNGFVQFAKGYYSRSILVGLNVRLPGRKRK